MAIVSKIIPLRYRSEITSETHFQSKLTFVNRYISFNLYVLNAYTLWFITSGKTVTFTRIYVSLNQEIFTERAYCGGHCAKG